MLIRILLALHLLLLPFQQAWPPWGSVGTGGMPSSPSATGVATCLFTTSSGNLACPNVAGNCAPSACSFALTSGNTVVAVLTCGVSCFGTPTCTWNGASMTQIGPGTNFTDSIEQHAYYMPNVTGATGVGTCSIPSAGAGHVLEIHWIQLQNVQTSPLDVAVTVSSGSNNPVAAASGMLAEANEVVLGLFSIDGVSCAGNGPWNNSFIPSANGCTDNGGGISTGDANLVVSSTAPVTASYSTETTTSSIMTVLSFKH